MMVLSKESTVSKLEKASLHEANEVVSSPISLPQKRSLSALKTEAVFEAERLRTRLLMKQDSISSKPMIVSSFLQL